MIKHIINIFKINLDMNHTVSCVFLHSDAENSALISELSKSDIVRKVIIVNADENKKLPAKTEVLYEGNVYSTEALAKYAHVIEADYTMLFVKDTQYEMGQFAIERFLNVAADTGAGWVYSDFREIKDGKKQNHPVIDCQLGSLRDDFDFGGIVVVKTNTFKTAVSRMNKDLKYGGLYDLRLKVSQMCELCRIPEFLYTQIETDTRKSGEKQFDYVNPRNRSVQIEMEEAVTQHLKDINGYLIPEFKNIEFDNVDFPVKASVIIPVLNRKRTIRDAITSVLKQKTDFDFNVIAVDNHSTDGTTEIIAEMAANDSRLIHYIPKRADLGIGGCWNAGVHHEQCGMFSVQLDSDDMYIDENTLQKIVNAFYEQKCGMVVGTYKMTNFDLEEIPPGIIDHREWTEDNGRNNALRINGLGAPRAFYTPLLRDIKIPNTSYGEDYAVGLRISREYRIGRIYEPLYLCRRWDDNSDASLDIAKMNNHNVYKDRIRTIELKARIAMNR